jgi:homoserine dehydrogenase
MRKYHIGLIGYGTVGQGVVKILERKRSEFKKTFGVDFVISKLCDRSYEKKDTRSVHPSVLTRQVDEVINDSSVETVIELIGGLRPAKEIISRALSCGKNVITANKELIAYDGPELFALAQSNSRQLYFESAVGSGIPMIKMISEGLVGNDFMGIYGILNGTCNFILSEMSQRGLSFEEALRLAQEKGYAESDPTLDINGMDTTHKLNVLIQMAMGQHIPLKEIFTEGISQIEHTDIEHAESLHLTIKLLAIAKRSDTSIEARVHPTLIHQAHPLASINGVLNAVFLHTRPLGNILLSGEGAGQMAAASGVVSDLINLVSGGDGARLGCNRPLGAKVLRLHEMGEAKTKFYLRFSAPDKPGTLSKITAVLGQHGIGINSVTQKPHMHKSFVPVVMLTDTIEEKALRLALHQIHSQKMVRAYPVAIRMENLS